MTPIQQLTYDVVKRLQAKCEEEHRAPVCVNLLDIQREVNEMVKTALNGFIADRTMSWFKNLNGIPQFKIENPAD